MSISIVVSAVMLGVMSVIISVKKSNNFSGFVAFLTALVVVLLTLGKYDIQSQSIVYSLIGIVAINYIFSRVEMLRKNTLRSVLPIMSMAVFFLIYKSDNSVFEEDEYAIANKFLVMGSIFSVLAFELSQLAILALDKMFNLEKDESLLNASMLVFVGIAVFLGFFGGGAFGLMFVSLAFLISSFYRRDKTGGVAIGLLGLCSLPFILATGNVESVNLVSGDVLFGLFIGLFGMRLIRSLYKTDKVSLTLVLIVHVILLSLSILVIFLETMNANMGGIDAFAGVIVGFSVVQLIMGEIIPGAGVLSFLLVIGIYIPPYFVNTELQEFENEILTSNSNEKENDEDVIENKLIDELSGTYSFVQDNSKIAFTLGKDGETKGAIKKITGSCNIEDDFENSTIVVKMKVADLTTFNEYRDESLLEEEYFNAEVYPEMVYEATLNYSKEEGEYVANGLFTMLGVTKKLDVSIELIKSGEKYLLIGGGEIDRTLFGMTPSATEGNIVSFEYQVEIKQ